MPMQNNHQGGIGPVVSTFDILVAAHEMTATRILAALQPFGYRIVVETNGISAQKRLSGENWDLVIGSSDLPQLDGFLLLRAARANPRTAEVPFLMIVSAIDPEEEVRAFQLGADEVITEATRDVALRARVRVLLRLSTYRRRLQNEKRMLGIKVALRTRELTEITMAMVAALEKATELSDRETGQHILRVSTYSAILAEEMGMGQDFVEKIKLYAPLHDVGKVGVPDHILKKEDLLTEEEFQEMKKHTIYGYELLMAAKADKMACNIALSHHERADGSGYPYGLAGEKIPVEARIVAVADVFDALITVRRYKKAIEPEVAFKTIIFELANKFDRDVLKAFERRYPDMLEVFLRHK